MNRSNLSGACNIRIGLLALAALLWGANGAKGEIFAALQSESAGYYAFGGGELDPTNFGLMFQALATGANKTVLVAGPNAGVAKLSGTTGTVMGATDDSSISVAAEAEPPPGESSPGESGGLALGGSNDLFATGYDSDEDGSISEYPPGGTFTSGPSIDLGTDDEDDDGEEVAIASDPGADGTLLGMAGFAGIAGFVIIAAKKKPDGAH